jgi:hypothetical protein
MPLTVTVNTVGECLRTDCNILADDNKKKPVSLSDRKQTKTEEENVLRKESVSLNSLYLNIFVSY